MASKMLIRPLDLDLLKGSEWDLEKAWVLGNKIPGYRCSASEYKAQHVSQSTTMIDSAHSDPPIAIELTIMPSSLPLHPPHKHPPLNHRLPTHKPRGTPHHPLPPAQHQTIPSLHHHKLPNVHSSRHS